MCPFCALGNPPYPFTFPFPHLLLCLLVSFTFSLFPFLLASSVFFLFCSFPFYQSSLTPFPGRMLQEATKPGFSFLCVDIVLYVFLVLVFVVLDLVLSCRVIVVSPFCRSFVCSLLRAGFQPTLDPSAETFMSVQ